MSLLVCGGVGWGVLLGLLGGPPGDVAPAVDPHSHLPRLCLADSAVMWMLMC